MKFNRLLFVILILAFVSLYQITDLPPKLLIIFISIIWFLVAPWIIRGEYRNYKKFSKENFDNQLDEMLEEEPNANRTADFESKFKREKHWYKSELVESILFSISLLFALFLLLIDTVK